MDKMMEKKPRTPLDEVKASLLYLKSLGVDGVACSDEAAALLKGMGQPAPRQTPKPLKAPIPDRAVQSVKRDESGGGRPLPPRPPVPASSNQAASPRTLAPETASSGASSPEPSSPRVLPPSEGVPPQYRAPNPGVGGGHEETLASIRDDMGECTRCGLFRGRDRIVFGAGNPKARLMLIGDMPLAEEGHAGLPFLGESGELLGKMLQAMGLRREDVYLSNILKCCPSNPQQRPDMSVCLSFLERQIAVVRPEVICTLGAVAAQTLLRMGGGVASIRGQFQNYRGRKLMPTYHPTFLLRHPEHKRSAWQDLQQVMAVLKLGNR